MWSSLRIAASGMMANQRALDVAADNLTKMQTPGSKSERVSFLEMAPDLRYFNVPDADGNSTLQPREVGKGVATGSTLQNLSRGAFLATGNPLDVAVDGDAVLEVTLPNGQPAYSRGGPLQVDGLGQLITSTGAVMSPGITIPPEAASVEIRPDGTVLAVSQDGLREAVGQLRLVRFANPEGLLHIGQNLLQATEASGAPIDGAAGEPGIGTIAAGILEASNIDPREEYLRIVQAQRAYQLNVRALRTVDEMLASANNLRK
ncbi:MAG: flagellar hook-basal body complex protein [Chloroflexi bacterium]|nr:flagellar hook-basal body complex protein [Chloroflexota bacterium]